MADSSELKKDAQAYVDFALGELYGNNPGLIEIAKIKLSFWDKLVVLDVGSLALLFSVAGANHHSWIGDGGIGYLSATCKLLILSIGAAVSAQWFGVASTTYLQRHRLALRVHWGMQRAVDALATNNEVLIGPPASLLNQMNEEVETMQPRARRMELLSHWAGTVAWFSAIGGFFWLYKFIHANFVRV